MYNFESIFFQIRMMINKLIACILLLSGASVFSQVGIETEFPKGIFHVDGSKDNPKNATTAVSSNQQSNDVIVLQGSGKVGVGTTAPDRNLEINNGTTNGAIKIVDGNQGAGRYLMSDKDGLATWVKPNSFNSAVIWTYSPPAQVTSFIGQPNSDGTFPEGGSNRTYTNLSLTNLTKGKWIVNVGLRLNTPLPLSSAFWLHAKLSSSTTSATNTGWVNKGPAGNATGYASVIYGDGTTNGKGFFTGTTIIEVTNSTLPALYLLLENSGQWTFDTSSPENYFYAIPIN